jgi:hypothetical protein
LSFDPQLPAALQYQLMNEQLAAQVQTGAVAGRTYGGCASQFTPNQEAGKESGSDKPDPQGIYGGRDGPSTSREQASEVCEYTHNGCYCCAYNKDGTARTDRLTVKARRGKDGVAHCLRSGCNAWLPSKGKGYKGDIWHRAQALSKAGVEE